MTLASFCIGVAIVFANLGVMFFIFKRINKKSIALVSSAIVVKYAALAVVLWRVLAIKQLDVRWFLVGTSSVLVVVVLYYYRLRWTKEPD